MAVCAACMEMPLTWNVPGDPIPTRELCPKHRAERVRMQRAGAMSLEQAKRLADAIEEAERSED